EAATAARIAQQEEERIIERRQEKLDRAIEAALGGNLKKADDAIVAAEKAGVAADQSHWLRGLVHYQQAKFDDAIREFESSIKFKPSVAAYAMNYHALFLLGNFPALQQRISEYNKLGSMTPETAEDYLCRGFVLGLAKKDQGLADLDRAIAMRDTLTAHA